MVVQHALQIGGLAVGDQGNRQAAGGVGLLYRQRLEPIGASRDGDTKKSIFFDKVAGEGGGWERHKQKQ